jgi:hypothetical protein
MVNPWGRQEPALMAVIGGGPMGTPTRPSREPGAALAALPELDGVLGEAEAAPGV